MLEKLATLLSSLLLIPPCATQRRLTRWIDAEEATKDCLNRSQYRSREAASSQYIHDLASSMSSMRNHDKLLSSLFDMVATTVRGVVLD